MPHAAEFAGKSQANPSTKTMPLLIHVDPSHTPTLSALESLRQDGNIKASGAHPSLPLKIYNYTPKVQFQSKWNQDLLTTRGLVMNIETGEVVARPLTKSFSWGDRLAKQAVEDAERAMTNRNEESVQSSEGVDRRSSRTLGDQISSNPISTADSRQKRRVVYEKLDGSMILWFFDTNSSHWICSSRGSFTSPHADSADALARAMGLDAPGRCDKAYTYMFELLDRNLMVKLDYGPVTRIVLIAVIETKTGTERPLQDEAQKLGIECAQEIPQTQNLSIEELAKRDVPGQEGYVVRWPNGARVKVKFASYLGNRKDAGGDKVLTQTVLNHLCIGGDLKQLLSDIADERYTEVRDIKDKWGPRIKSYKKRLKRVLEGCLDMELRDVKDALRGNDDLRCDCGAKESGQPLCLEITPAVVCSTLGKMRKSGVRDKGMDKLVSEAACVQFKGKI